MYEALSFLLDIAFDASLFMDGEDTPPRLHNTRLNGKTVDSIVRNSLNNKIDAVQGVHNAALQDRMKEIRDAIGERNWKQLMGDVSRISETAAALTEGLSPDELFALRKNPAARGLLGQYAMLKNQLAMPGKGETGLAETLAKSEAALKETVAGMARGGAPKTLEHVLGETIKEAPLLDQLKSAMAGMEASRMVKQSWGTAFRSMSNLKTSIGSAATFKSFTPGFLFYTGLAGLIDATWHAVRPSTPKPQWKLDKDTRETLRHGKPEEKKDLPDASWFGIALESAIGFAALGMAIAMAGRTITPQR